MRVRLLLGMTVALLTVCASAVVVSEGGTGTVDATCAATPITHKLPDPTMRNLSRNWVHIGKLWMGWTFADDGFTAHPSGQKVAFYRSKGSAFGKLRLSGMRLDGEAPPLKAFIPRGYAITWGFQPTGLNFSTPGCWKVVAHVGLTQRYEFIVQVIAPS